MESNQNQWKKNKENVPKTGFIFLMQNVISLISSNFRVKCDTVDRFKSK